jgi:hypothetical protein
MYCIQHCFTCRPSDSTVSKDAGIEPRTVATSALAVRRSNHWARSHPLEVGLTFFILLLKPLQVNDRFKLDWGTYLTTSEQIIYGLIDGRGSGFKVGGLLNNNNKWIFIADY